MILRFMKVSFKCRNVKYLICPAVLFAGTFLFVPHTWAASCCGGGGAAGLILPKFSKAMVDVSVSMEKYDGYWDKKGVYSKDPPHSDLRQYRLNLGYGHRLASRWQGSISIPYVWNENKYPAIESRTDGVGDAAVSLLYEAFDNVQCVWKVRNLEDLRPAAYFGLSLTAPTGISIYDNGLFPTKTAKESFDITGRGFYRLDGNMLMEKTIFPWTASILLSYGTHLERTVESEYGKPILKPYHKRLGDRALGTLSLGYTHFLESVSSITATAAYSDLWEGEGTIDGQTDETTGMRKKSVAGTIAYATMDRDWVFKLSWSSPIKQDGWGENFPASDVYTIGVSHVFR